MTQIEKIESFAGKLLAIIIKSDFQIENSNFFTPNEFPLQFGVHDKMPGFIVRVHKHKPFERISIPAQEIFFVDSGKVQVDIYDETDHLFKNLILEKGDWIILNTGHGVKFLEKTRMIEIKQGPYRGTAEEKEFIGGD